MDLLDRLVNTGVYLVCVQHVGDQTVQSAQRKYFYRLKVD